MRLVSIVAVIAFGLAPSVAPAATPPQKVTVTGKISALKRSTITIQGARKVTCRVAGLSPRALGFRIGASAKVTCTRGVLKGISRLTAPAVVAVPSPSTPAPPVTAPPSGSGAGTARPVSQYSLAGNGTIASLDAGSVTFTSGIVCSLDSGGPFVASYKVGDRATFHCGGPLPEGLTSGPHLLDLARTGALVFKLISIAPAA